ncbi:MAG: hypothetical protein WA102_03235 [Candidatus Methanoperedens sp.]
MKCKHSDIKCVTRIINQTWEESRACEYGVSCSYKEKRLINN